MKTKSDEIKEEILDVIDLNRNKGHRNRFLMIVIISFCYLFVLSVGYNIWQYYTITMLSDKVDNLQERLVKIVYDNKKDKKSTDIIDKLRGDGNE